MTYGMFLALLFAPVAAAAQSNPSIIRNPPPETLFPGPMAVDHVSVMVGNKGSGPPGEDRIVSIRSGDWLREDREGAVHHSNLRTGTSFTYTRDPAGRPAHFSILRSRSDSEYYVYSRVLTGEKDRALGENCEVWSTTRVAEEWGVEYRSCETSDGIQLWRRALSKPAGTMISSYRAVSIKRRAVRRDEVMPPRSLFDRSYWLHLGTPQRPASGVPFRNYEIQMAAGARVNTFMLVRRRYPWTYRENEDGGGRRLLIENRAILLQYEEEGNGRPVRLSISRMPPGQVEYGDRKLLVPEVPAREQTILGEECLWHGPPAPNELNGLIVTGVNKACLTSDGIPLATVSGGRLIVSFVATSLERRTPPRRSVLPGKEIFSWTHWDASPSPSKN